MPCLRVCVRVWVCPQLSPSLCFAQLDQPLPSFFSASFFVHIPPRSASFSYLLLTANVRPLCPVLYSDLPWWSSIRTSFNLLGSNWSRDCVWLYCFRWDTNQNKISLLSSAAVSLKNLSAFFFFPSFLPHLPPSISFSLHIRWEKHTHTHTHTLSCQQHADSSHPSSWLGLITAMRGELFRVPLLYLSRDSCVGETSITTVETNCAAFHLPAFQETKKEKKTQPSLRVCISFGSTCS